MKTTVGSESVWVNYHHLDCFHQVARLGSLVEASKVMSIGSSALSIQIRRLEDALGIQLFLREGRRLALTEAGKIVYNYSKEIFRLGSEMVESIRDRPAPGRYNLRIGCLDSIPKHLSTELASFALAGGKCTVSLIEGKLSELLGELLEHRLDILVANSVPPVMGDQKLHSKRIARLPLWVVGTSQFGYLRKDFPRSLDGAPFVLPTADSSVRHEFDSYANQNGLQPNVVAETQDLMVQKLLALRGTGVIVAPEFAVREYIDSKMLYLIGQLEKVFEDFYLVTAPRRIKNPVATVLLQKFRVS